MQVTYGYKRLETDAELRKRLLALSKSKHISLGADRYLIETAMWLDKLHGEILDGTAWDIYDTQRRIIECP